MGGEKSLGVRGSAERYLVRAGDQSARQDTGRGRPLPHRAEGGRDSAGLLRRRAMFFRFVTAKKNPAVGGGPRCLMRACRTPQTRVRPKQELFRDEPVSSRRGRVEFPGSFGRGWPERFAMAGGGTFFLTVGPGGERRLRGNGRGWFWTGAAVFFRREINQVSDMSRETGKCFHGTTAANMVSKTGPPSRGEN